ncbi:hypothetical protein VOLCADRAFT_91715 [Volvox carteri f. nagariensis]|uniref:4a-hydroxytetrahydrobiopterin dehydratase n=1 Tax=Volvox carteri f. nagariensis TaxID=3068 RepID=D8TXT2_VOLCA|nr:uncharacterized protein VOLCADRAFT_91715 [Volvox carteri f. nagariensis]EFJ47780.1 hypothetical protein VOLCADRAFT_91715 [Volvox carteri f. nagariensis]|eukprot:XP_002951251.1 hypothetical protein VOLCADRAFT_91715 [Volvox carteri f. nagariensis]
MSSTTLNIQGPGADKLRSAGCGGACSRDTPKVEPAELDDYMRSLPAWHLNADKTMITRSFTAKNFMAAIRFFNKLAEVAEEEGHHPDIHLRNFREVEINLSTHAVSGLTMPDLVMAAKLDALEVEYSPKWAKQEAERLAATAATTTGGGGDPLTVGSWRLVRGSGGDRETEESGPNTSIATLWVRPGIALGNTMENALLPRSRVKFNSAMTATHDDLHVSRHCEDVETRLLGNAEQVAAVWRGFYSRWEGPAAETIQKWWRGHVARRFVQALRSGHLLKSGAHEHVVETAAVVIQRYWRGLRGRREAAERRKAVLDIQRWWKHVKQCPWTSAPAADLRQPCRTSLLSPQQNDAVKF